MPGQVWNDESLHGTGGPLLVISVDSAYAYCRTGRDGHGEPRRIALSRFGERRRDGLTLVSTSDGLEDLVERRALTALWELDYVGSPATTETVCAVLGGYYSTKRIEAALSDAEADGLALRSGLTADDEWRLTGGGRRIAPSEPAQANDSSVPASASASRSGELCSAIIHRGSSSSPGRPTTSAAASCSSSASQKR